MFRTRLVHQNCLRLQLSDSQTSVSAAALNSLRGERDRYLGLRRSLVGQIYRLDSDFNTLVTRAQNSRPYLCRDVGLLLEEFCASVNEYNIFQDAPLPPPIEQVVVFLRLHRFNRI